jgi:hypothetical protein
VARGQRGRGRQALIDVAAVQAWRAARSGGGDQAAVDAAMLTLAGEVPALLASAFGEAYRLVEGSDKRRAAGVMAGAWFVASTALLDRLRERCPAVPELQAVPNEIENLRKISADD